MTVSFRNTPTPNGDYGSYASLGRIPGLSMVSVVSQNENIGGAIFADVWAGGGNLVYPTSAESWEVVSTTSTDTSSGTGARTVLITSLDENYEPQSVDVVLNGTTPVSVSGTHFRNTGE